MSAIAAGTGLPSRQRAPLRTVSLGVFDPAVTRRADGTIDLRNTQSLPPYAD
jgi:hypothetical protein